MEPFTPGKLVFDKLLSLANLTEDRLDNFRLYGNLNIIKHGISEQIKSFFSSTEIPFDQVKEFFKALDALQVEIKRNDYALLKDEKARSLLPVAVHNLRKMSVKWINLIDHYLVTQKIVAIRTLIFAHIPLTRDVQIDREYCNLFKKDQYEEIMSQYQESLGLIIKELNALPALSTNDHCLDLLLHGCALLNELSLAHKAEHKSILFGSLHQMTFLLCELPVWNEKQRHFLEVIHKSHIFSYLNTFSGSRPFEFRYFLQTKLVHCLNSYETPLEVLNNFHHVCLVANRFNDFMKSEGSSSGNFVESFKFQRFKLLKRLLPILALHITTDEVREKLKVVCLYKEQFTSQPSSFLMDLIHEFYTYDCSTTERDNDPKKLRVDVLHNSGLLVKEGDCLRISDGWMKVIEELIPDPLVFLNEAFGVVGSLAERNPRRQYYKRFLKGSSPLLFPKYLLQKFLSNNDEEISNYLIQKMALLDQEQSRKIVFDEIKEAYYKSYIQLLLASEAAANAHFLEVSLKALDKALIETFRKNRVDALTFKVPERIFIQLVNRINLVELKKVDPKCVIELRKFPSMTHAGLTALVEKIPDLSINDFNYHQPSDLSNFTLVHGNEKLYIHTAVLTRSSEYFRALLSNQFREGRAGTTTWQLEENEFAFFKKWMNCIFCPQEIVYMSQDRNIRQFTLKPEEVSEELHLAQFYQMDKLQEFLNKVHEHSVTPQHM